MQLKRFFEEFTSLLESISTSKSTIILTGDLNIHVDNANDVMALRFLDMLDAFGLVQHINRSTHARGHTLDIVITQRCCTPHDSTQDLCTLYQTEPQRILDDLAPPLTVATSNRPSSPRFDADCGG